MLGLCCCLQAFSSRNKAGLLSSSVCRLLVPVASVLWGTDSRTLLCLCCAQATVVAVCGLIIEALSL